MTRALSHLVNGDLTGALSLHPLVVPILVIGMVAWVWLLLRRLGWARPLSLPLANVVMGTMALALIAVWVMRYLSGTLPPV
jgi:hypothetical protein